MTKPDKIYLIFQLILVNCILFTLETLTWPWKFFWSPMEVTTITKEVKPKKHPNSEHFFENDGDDVGDGDGDAAWDSKKNSKARLRSPE